MFRPSNYFVFAAVFMITATVSSSALAQDDELIDYDDAEAAGTVTEAEAEAADAPGDEPAKEEDSADWSVTSDPDPEDDATAEVSGQADVEEGGVLAWEDSGEDSDEEQPERLKLKMWQFGAARYHMNLTGTTGLLHMAQAGSGPTGTFGVGVHGSYFKYNDYLIYGDEHTGMRGNLNLRITPLDFLEIHMGIYAAANNNNKEYPTLFQTLGDMDLGLKGFYSFTGWLTLGLDVGVYLLNSVGEVAMDFSGTSFGSDLLATFDFAALNSSLPLRMHVKAGYFFDNASNLTNDLEKKNGGCGHDDDGDGEVEYEGCMSPVERTALEIDRNDQFRWAIGIDSPLPYVSPMVEYSMEIPVNRQDFTCPTNIPGGSYDSCMVDEMGRGFRQVLTIGARILPPIEDLAIDLGVDIGLTGYAPTVHELAAEAPYRVMFGASYSFDPFPEPTLATDSSPVVEPVVLPPPPPPAHVAGLVHDELSVDTPVPGARIYYDGTQFNAQVSGEDGRFASYDLAAGPLTITVKADGYNDGTFTLEMPETGIVEHNFALTALPKKGHVAVQVLDGDDKPISGLVVSSEGVTSETFTTDANGKFAFETDGGDVLLKVDDARYLSKRTSVAVKVDTEIQVQMQLRAVPKKSLVVVNTKQIRIKRKILFRTDSDEIDPQSFDLLDEVADTLIKSPQIKKVEVQGHTDDRGRVEYNVDLSDRRSRSVVKYLVEQGVAADRLSNKGFGPSKPIAPNVTSGGRARNRRVEFHIQDSE